jgi:hypothetical protein
MKKINYEVKLTLRMEEKIEREVLEEELSKALKSIRLIKSGRIDAK